MVLPDRIELSTSPLPRECSTTELRQRNRRRIKRTALEIGPETARSLPQGAAGCKQGRRQGFSGLVTMTESTSNRTKPPSDPRQERLAQALRDNLKRRKSQARERRKAESETPEAGGPEASEPSDAGGS